MLTPPFTPTCQSSRWLRLPDNAEIDLGEIIHKRDSTEDQHFAMSHIL